MGGIIIIINNQPTVKVSCPAGNVMLSSGYLLGLGVVPWEQLFFYENERNYRKRTELSKTTPSSEKKNKPIERVLKNIGRIIKRINVERTEIA